MTNRKHLGHLEHPLAVLTKKKTRKSLSEAGLAAGSCFDGRDRGGCDKLAAFRDKRPGRL